MEVEGLGFRSFASIRARIFSYMFNVFFWVNCKLHPWSLGLIGFYTPKFQKLDFIPWSLIPLAIYPPWLVFAVKWHIIMLMYFIIASLALKLRRFNDDQVRSWHNQNYIVLGLNLKHKFLAWNDVVSCHTLKLKTKTKDPMVCLLEHSLPDPNPGSGGNNIFSKSWPPLEATGKARGSLYDVVVVEIDDDDDNKVWIVVDSGGKLLMMVIINFISVEVTVTVIGAYFNASSVSSSPATRNSPQPSTMWPPIPTAWFFKHFLYLVITDEVVGNLCI